VAGHNKETGRKTGAQSRLVAPRPVMVRALGLSPRSFDRLVASGVLHPVTPRHGRRSSTFDVAATVRAYLAYREEKISDSLENPRDRRDRAIAEWTELRISRERALLLPREQVVAEGQRYIAAVQARLRSIAPRLRQETKIDEAIGVKVDEMLEEAIAEMAGWHTMLDLLTTTEDA
jgi:hypothetical protein